ncbi:MAG: polymer-forming cytoskeletal protein [Spirochaetaceae bacterium]|jgi:cytoskeletal protein CcmA (bactofilin family)|nr:polymer-forming cytoskeletal protein [Spirochaetaceae bacterium]
MAKNLIAGDGRNITRFGPETEFEGELTFTDNLIIMGKFSGAINATGNLEIDEKSTCKVDSITADRVVISGKVEGDIIAPSRVEMKSNSRITGNVTTRRLRIEDGVDFMGRVTMLEVDEKTPDIFAITASEYKALLAESPEAAELPEAPTEGEKKK